MSGSYDQSERYDQPLVGRGATIQTLNDDGTVIVNLTTDPGMGHGPCIGWVPRADGTTPSTGDACLIVEDDTGVLWIAAWRPIGELMPPSP